MLKERKFKMSSYWPPPLGKGYYLVQTYSLAFRQPSCPPGPCPPPPPPPPLGKLDAHSILYFLNSVYSQHNGLMTVVKPGSRYGNWIWKATCYQENDSEAAQMSGTETVSVTGLTPTRLQLWGQFIQFP